MARGKGGSSEGLGLREEGRGLLGWRKSEFGVGERGVGGE